ncbi:MAG: hypothetical protein UU51_C0015G0013 [Microgenomates group bacterium GW2011_GWC1_41_20]|uniref:Uncharacterized protein n=7 Tax=Candidatus Woeseibacteriota TaxID=1752722 RepID=A0A0G0RST6_9BACT|nr:MAG: hypothetical protein UT76_C0014G0003 [Candidatus Woesebacteria bacterium GW2011_GWB1_40_12]KKR55734.1 MAG: hypothetical protein UT93_C0019G0002 [Candidatus Woesebacteria bacterium GW2011_GWF1_40_24]KKR89640.1 MAG: hypothetical protein UU39_C0029G0003 [Candidatus Woesebacteria bacterium GW2011_GWD1_41_12]KKS00213.1 MAG: hypothetical protein UU51_C0015G0013 [Microgenomates group bacterium GW2011_GWC1_41_20]KKS04167.1 MAG: hypothetical protein UU57_C0023G0011 [Candidatus Woesebacteria bact
METLNLSGFDIWIVIKVLTLLVLAMYIVFAFVITRQVKVMTSTLTLGIEGVAKLLALLHLLFAIFVFVSALIVL